MKLATIICHRFPQKVMISKARRVKHWHPGDSIPQKYRKEGYVFKDGIVKGKKVLVDLEGNPVIANPLSAGKPHYKQISGNDIVAGYGSPHIRNKITHELKDYFAQVVKKYVREHGPITRFPLRVEWDAFMMAGEENWDLSNLFMYYKYFEDSCVREKLIPDDSVKFITHSPGPRLVKIDDDDDRAFIFRFFLDERIVNQTDVQHTI
jgi:hypothetical protein